MPKIRNISWWTPHICMTCKYDDYDAFEPPCDSCVHNRASVVERKDNDNWEEKVSE